MRMPVLYPSRGNDVNHRDLNAASLIQHDDPPVEISQVSGPNPQMQGRWNDHQEQRGAFVT